MDPAKNNSFGSSQVPNNLGNTGSGDVGFDTANFGAQNTGNVAQAPGAIVSDGNTAVDSTGGLVSESFPSGGISVDDNRQGPRRGLIIGVIVVFLLLLSGGLVALAVTNGMFGNGNDSDNSQKENTVSVAKSAFNEYISYIAYGKNSAEEITEDTLTDLLIEPYFESVSFGDIDNYAKEAEAKFDAFSSKYQSSNDVVDLVSIKLFYHDYASHHSISFDELQALYIKNGLEPTRNIISTYYDYSSEDEVLRSYIDSAKKMNNLQLDLIDGYDKAGCFNNNALVENCSVVNSNNDEVIMDLFSKMSVDKNILSENAVDAVSSIYDYLYENKEIINE